MMKQIPRSPVGFTLVELLVATTLSLLILGAVIQVFSKVSDSVTDSRALLEAADRLRFASARLQQDLAGITVKMTQGPPRKPENNEGYFEYIEGPMGVRPIDTTNLAAAASPIPINGDVTDNGNSDLQPIGYHPIDSTVGDTDDILMFTTRGDSKVFVGKCANANPPAIRSDTAEVAWFVRGRTLHRRTLLVAPKTPGIAGLPTQGFYANYDISVRVNTGSTWQMATEYRVGDVVSPTVLNRHYYVCTVAGKSSATTQPTWPTNGSTVNDGTAPTQVTWRDLLVVAPNSLGDLTKRENRFAHWQGIPTAAPYDPRSNFPFDVRNWGQYGLPTLRECSAATWDIAAAPSAPAPKTDGVDFWVNGTSTLATDPRPFPDNALGSGTRVADDVILTNVISFDVKAYDTTFEDPITGNLVGRYVDLGYNNTVCDHNGYVANNNLAKGLSHRGHIRSGLNAVATTDARVYDTYTNHYESDGIRESTAPTTTNPVIDATTNGNDDNGNVVIDESVYDGDPDPTTSASGENETAPPYPIPLRGIQVKIRIFEPDSRQIREVTVVQDFLTQ